MKILIAAPVAIPVSLYGGTQRVVWSLGKELVKMGHEVTYLVPKGSSSDFAKIIHLDTEKSISAQIPNDIDVVHLNVFPNDNEVINKPYIITLHGNINEDKALDRNTVFVSRNHAERYGSASFVHNGLDWDDYTKPNLSQQRDYFHFLGNAAWRVKNVKGAISSITATPKECLRVLGGKRFNVKMGARFTFSPRVRFYGFVGGEQKDLLLNGSKGLVFPVKWHEPFGLAITESLYYGCPVFGTPYGSLPELVANEVGFLSSQRSELTRAILNADSFDKIRCHEYARDQFNSKMMALDYLRKYEEVLNGRPLNSENPKLTQYPVPKFLDWEK